MSTTPNSFYFKDLKDLLIKVEGNWYREDRFFKMGLEGFSLGSPSNSNAYESIKIKFSPAFEGWQELRILKSKTTDSYERIHLIQFKDISNNKIIRSIDSDDANKILRTLEQIKINAEPESLGIEIIVDNSSSSRKLYSTPSGFWDGLSGYAASVHNFYEVLHLKLIEQLKEKILENDLRNVVIFDVGCGTGLLIMKLFNELTSDPRLYGRVSKILGIDFSEENIQVLGGSCASLSSQVVKENSELTGHLSTDTDKVKEKLRLSQCLTSAHMIWLTFGRQLAFG
jgi:hypothetical protein